MGLLPFFSADLNEVQAAVQINGHTLPMLVLTNVFLEDREEIESFAEKEREKLSNRLRFLLRSPSFTMLVIEPRALTPAHAPAKLLSKNPSSSM